MPQSALRAKRFQRGRVNNQKQKQTHKHHHKTQTQRTTGVENHHPPCHENKQTNKKWQDLYHRKSIKKHELKVVIFVVILLLCMCFFVDDFMLMFRC